MEINKNYIGKIVRMTYTYDGAERERVGVVYGQQKQGDGVSFSMLLTNGQSWNPTFREKENLKITSVRIDENLRSALTEYCKVKIKHQEFLDHFWKEKLQHENNVRDALENVKKHTNEISISDCMEEMRTLFQEKYPSTGGFWKRTYFDCCAGSAKEITVCHCQEIEKYATPEKYPFLYREYDDNMFVNEKTKGYKEFCERNAPAIKPELKQFKSDVHATIGGNNFLEVQRSYTIPLKYGLTKRSIDHIKETVFGMKKSLDDVIKTSEKQGRSKSTRNVKGKNEREI